MQPGRGGTRQGAVRERWGGRKGFVRPQKGAGVQQGKGRQQGPCCNPQYVGPSWWVLLRDPTQKGEKLLPLLVPDLGGKGILLPSLSETSTSKSNQKSSWAADISHEAAPGEMTRCEIYSTTPNPIHQQDSWFLSVRCGAGTPREDLNQRAAPFPTALSPAPLSPGVQPGGLCLTARHTGTAPHEPGQPGMGATLGDAHGQGVQPRYRAGCGRSTSRPRDCGPQRAAEGHVASPCPPFSLDPSRQPSEWAPMQALGSPSSPCPAPCASTPVSPVCTLLFTPPCHPPLISTQTGRAQAPAAPGDQCLKHLRCPELSQGG